MEIYGNYCFSVVEVSFTQHYKKVDVLGFLSHMITMGKYLIPGPK